MAFYKARGFQIRHETGDIVVTIPHACPHLTVKGCDIYSERPMACQRYDGRFDPTMKDRCKLPKDF